MRAEITTYDGKGYRLPPAVAYGFEYACGTPCDSFWMELAGSPEDAERYGRAIRLTAWEGEEPVFTGVVDEVEWSLSQGGSRVTLSGRSMAALLLDNEALPMDYSAATLEDILRNHVTPYGIAVGESGNIPPCQGFSVASGQSEWQVVYNFACYHGGLSPRFDRRGRLMLAPLGEGRVKRLGERVPITAMLRNENRHGVLSEVLVRDQRSRQVERVTNPAFLAQGGQCRRVVTVGGGQSAQALRYSGQFQMGRSMAGKSTLTMTVPKAFFAWPGELIAVERPGWNGTWRVLESTVTEDETGRATTLKLGVPDTVI